MTKDQFFEKWGCLMLTNYKAVLADFEEVLAEEWQKGFEDGIESQPCKPRVMEVG